MIVIIFGHLYPEYFHCQKPVFYQAENLLIIGIPDIVGAILNILVSFYISFKIIKKRRKIHHFENCTQPVNYQVNTDQLFFKTEVSSISPATHTCNDVVVEDIEHVETPNSIKNEKVFQDSEVGATIEKPSISSANHLEDNNRVEVLERD